MITRANLYNTHHASLDSIPLEILEPENPDKDTVVKYANWLKYRIDTTGMTRNKGRLNKMNWNILVSCTLLIIKNCQKL